MRLHGKKLQNATNVGNNRYLPEIMETIRSFFSGAKFWNRAVVKRFITISLPVVNTKMVRRIFLGIRMARSFDVINEYRKFPTKSDQKFDQ